MTELLSPLAHPEPDAAHPGVRQAHAGLLAAGGPLRATAGTAWFPDLSEHNGPPDWDALERAWLAGTLDAVAMRAGFGTVRADREFARNQAEARRRGIPAIYYWFTYPAYNPPAAEAAMFNATVGPLRPREAMCGDFEDDPAARPFPRGAAGLQWCAAFLSGLQSPRLTTWWYTYPSLLATVGLQPLWQTWPFWIADYSSSRDSAFATAIARQFTDCGSTPGVGGCCDQSRVLKPPLGQWLTGGAPAPAPTSISSGGDSSMVTITGADGRIHRVTVTEARDDQGKLVTDPDGNRGGPVTWAALAGGTGGIDGWGGGDGELPGGGGWIAAGTLAAALWTWPDAPLASGGTGPRELLIVQGRGRDGQLWRAACFTDDFGVQQPWAHAAGPAPAVPGAPPVPGPKGDAGPDVRPAVAAALEAAVTVLKAG